MTSKRRIRYLIFQDMADADEDRRIDCKERASVFHLPRSWEIAIGQAVCAKLQEFAEFIASGKAEKVGIKVARIKLRL